MTHHACTYPWQIWFNAKGYGLAVFYPNFRLSTLATTESLGKKRPRKVSRGGL